MSAAAKHWQPEVQQRPFKPRDRVRDFEDSVAESKPHVPSPTVELGLRQHFGHSYGNDLDCLQGLRSVLALECLFTEVIHATIGAAKEQLQREGEDFGVLSSWRHGRVLSWAEEHWTPEWLCGEQRPQAERQPLFRNSAAIFCALDFDEMPEREDTPCPEGPGALVSWHRDRGLFEDYALGWSFQLTLDDPKSAGQWVGRLEGWLRGTTIPGLIVVVQGGLAPNRCTGPGHLEHPDYLARKQQDTAQQDALLLMARLWREHQHFAVVVGLHDDAITATLCRLPGMLWTKGAHAILLHSYPEEFLPERLFHLL